MNIIEVTREILNGFQGIGQFGNPESIHIDYTDSTPDSYGLSSIGDTLISEDITGNQLRQHNFVMYSVTHSFNDYSRLMNSSFLLDLGYYLEKVKGIEFDVHARELGTVVCDDNLYPDENLCPNGEVESKKAILTRITSANGMMFEVLDDDMNEGVRYQLQIYVQYEVESEDF